MFVPLRDENPTRRPAFVNYGLIALNIAVFLYTWPAMTSGQTWLAAGYGLVPTRLVNDPVGESFTILTSMFMHGSLEHIGSNMLFLYIFGDNLEDVLGHLRYLAFYLLSGLAAGLTQLGFDLGSMVPMIGASGAIAGVVGGYMLLFPRAPIVAVNTVPLLWFVMGIFPVIPAWLVAAEFFIVNLLLGVMSLGAGGSSGGVAVFAHLGGFVGGLLLLRPLMGRRSPTKHDNWSGFRRGPASEGAGAPRWQRRRPRRTNEDD